MNELKVFEFEGNKVRTQDKNGTIWFCGKDLCDILGVENSGNKFSVVCEDDIREMDAIDSIGREHKMKFVNESGMYQIIFQSRKEEALRFKKWVTSEVLPTIRKTGGYGQVTSLQALHMSIGKMVEQEKQLQIVDAKLDDLDSRLDKLENKKPNIRHFSEKCLSLSLIRKTIFKGISEDNISTFLKSINHPTEESEYIVKHGKHGGEVLPNHNYIKEGLEEAYNLLIAQSKKINNCKKSYSMFHPVLQVYRIKISQIDQEQNALLSVLPINPLKG